MRAFDGLQFLFTQKKLSIDDKEDMVRLKLLVDLSVVETHQS